MEKLPKGAMLEAVMGEAALYDVSDLLPTHRFKRYKPRDPNGIDALIVHHSGRLSQNHQHFDGMYNSARFLATQRKDPTDGSIGWPGFAYMAWIPFGEIRDPKGNRVWFRGQPDDVRSWHTAGLNKRGWAVVLQGALGKHPASEHQIEVLADAVPWIRERFQVPLDNVIGHCEAGTLGGRSKRACPGSHAFAWLQGYRVASSPVC